MLRKVLYIVGGLFVTAVSVAAVVLGIWAYNLNTQLAQARMEYQALKGDYDRLNAEYSKAKDEFKAKSSQADADLNEANAKVTKLESDVKKLQNENNRLRTKLADIQDSVAMLSDFWFMSDSAFEHKVKASDDEQLKKLYANLRESQKMEDYIDLMTYMIQSIDDASSVSWWPLQVVNATVETGTVR